MRNYVIYKPFRKVNTIVGLEGKNWLKVSIIVLIGVILFFMLGNLTHGVEVKVSDQTIISKRYTLQDARSALKTVDSKTQALLSGIENPTNDQIEIAKEEIIDNLSVTQKQSLEVAEEYGVKSNMTDEELTELIPKTQIKYEPVMSDIARAIIFIIVPLVLSIVWFMDLKGFSYSTEFKRYRKFKKRQAVYISKRNAYLEQATQG